MHYSLNPLGNNRLADVVSQALDSPVTLLDTLEGGYILGVILACVLPLVRAVLDATVYKVRHARYGQAACSSGTEYPTVRLVCAADREVLFASAREVCGKQ